MSEIGIDITNEVPRALGNDAFDASDVVITMGCGDTCPIYPSKRYLDWELEDPAGRTLDEVRSIRDEIDRKVRSLVRDLFSTSQ